MLNVVEYNSLLYNSAIQKKENDITHFRMGGEKTGIRKYQNLDGSLTPLGRIHYGVGMSREEQRAAREAEDRRQEEIDYNRSKSIREMDDRELQEAVNRSRNEMLFEQNMITRSNQFLQSKVTEERLNQEYDELMYQKSRQKAERWMGRVERLGRFVGNLATTYGKIEDVKGKIEDTRAKRALADKNEWLAEQEHTKYDQGQWNFKKNVKEYEASKAAKAAEKEAERAAEKEAKKQAKAEKKQSIVSKVFGKKKDKDSKAADPEYIKKEGDQYIYSEKTKSKWKSVKEKIAAKKEAKAAAKREELKNQARQQILGDRIDRSSALDKKFEAQTPESNWSAKSIYDRQTISTNPGNWSYFNNKKTTAPSNWSAKSIYDRQTTPTKSGDWSYFKQKADKEKKVKDRVSSESRFTSDFLPVPEYGVRRNSAGSIISDAAARRKKMRKK